MARGILPNVLLGFGALLLGLSPGCAHAAPQAQISKLGNIGFGTIANFATDLQVSQNICVYSTGTSARYHVTASGSGTGSAFTVASGSQTMAYEVQWSSSSGQTSGTPLASGVALTLQTSGATNATCSSGPATSASLIVILRTATIQAATAGAYGGTLTLIVAPN